MIQPHQLRQPASSFQVDLHNVMMTQKATYQIEFQPIGKRVTALAGETILDAARQAGIDIHSACGGEGNCGQCQVVLLEGRVNPITPDDEFFLTAEELEKGYRLACRTEVLGDLKVHLPKESLVSGQRLQVEAQLGEIVPEPFVRAYALHMQPPELADLRSDLTRVLDGLQQEHQLEASRLWANLALVKSLPEILRAENWQVSVFLRDEEIVAVRQLGEKPWGLAVDLGTTKIAALLVDLESGKVLASEGAPNPQISYGEDVISRLNYAVRKPDGGQLLMSKVQAVIDELLGNLVKRAGGSRWQVVEAVIVANTAMSHLLLGLPVKQLAMAPYIAASNEPLEIAATALGLQMAPGGRVYIPPSIGGFVGSDHVAMVLGSELDNSELVTLGLDIGTNTEISLRIPGQSELIAVSCASGPAFEGAHIRDGMRAASGAIEKVRIANKGLELTTIDDQPAVGLCGSGILDAIAELYKNAYLNPQGRLDRNNSLICEGDHGWEYVLVPADRSGSGREIAITQHDINEIQLAKGAIQAGLTILLRESSTPPEAVQQVIVAGAFGSFLNIENAVAIGLFPKLPNASYRQVGNAAAVGAHWMLVSRTARQRANQIAERTRYLELTTYPKFNRQFALAMQFPQ